MISSPPISKSSNLIRVVRVKSQLASSDSWNAQQPLIREDLEHLLEGWRQATDYTDDTSVPRRREVRGQSDLLDPLDNRGNSSFVGTECS